VDVPALSQAFYTKGIVMTNAETRTVITAAAEAAIRVTAAQLNLDLCRSRVAALDQVRAGGIAAAKSSAVLEADSALLGARIDVEIAADQLVELTKQHAAALDAAKAERIAKAQRAAAVIDSEMVAMAAEFSQAFDAALEIGKKLQDLASRNHMTIPMNVSVPPVPAIVLVALERMPKPDPYNTPVHILRNGTNSTAWADRFAELTAIDVEVAA
jgi:hypothetical protein